MDPKETTQQEEIFYQDQNVTVTNSRFVANGKTYAMRNISSVSNYQIKKSITGGIVLIIIGIVVLAMDAILFGVILIGIGIAIIAMTKDDFSVQISSNSGESNALTSTDKIYIQKIVDAVNDAIIHRG